MKLGNRYRDNITGFEGIAVKIMLELNIPDDIYLESETLKENLPTGAWFTISRLIEIGESKLGFKT